MNKTTKTIISLAIVAVITVGVFKAMQNKKLEKSYEEGKNIPSRSVPKMHPSWDKNQDGLNDCEKDGTCDHTVDYSEPKPATPIKTQEQETTTKEPTPATPQEPAKPATPEATPTQEKRPEEEPPQASEEPAAKPNEPAPAKKETQKDTTTTEVQAKVSSEVSIEKAPVENKTIAAGNFVEIDSSHWAKGGVDVTEKSDGVYITFANNFKAANGPDLYVMLSEKQKLGGASGGFNPKESLNLGAISSNNGKQTYKVSKAEWEKYNYAIVIWCKEYNIHFSNAILQ